MYAVIGWGKHDVTGTLGQRQGNRDLIGDERIRANGVIPGPDQKPRLSGLHPICDLGMDPNPWGWPCGDGILDLVLNDMHSLQCFLFRVSLSFCV